MNNSELQSDHEDNNKNANFNKPKSNFGNLLMMFFRLFISPIDGWKKIKGASINVDLLCRKLFYPLIAIVSLAEFIQIFYNVDITVSSALQNAIITFVSFFLSYYTILFCADFIFKPEVRAKVTSNFGKIFIVMNLLSLILFYFIYEIFPIAGPILVFTPIYTIYLIIKGIKYLRIPVDNTNHTSVILISLIIGLPMLIHYLFSLIMPTVQ